jgi:hypothetical protein
MGINAGASGRRLEEDEDGDAGDRPNLLDREPH